MAKQETHLHVSRRMATCGRRGPRLAPRTAGHRGAADAATPGGRPVSAPAAYWVAVAVGIGVCATLCAACRRRPGPWVVWAGRAISLVLALDAVVFVIVPLTDGSWSVRASLPLALCNLALLVAAVACWEPSWLLAVELTYFWGLAGALQAVATPDLAAGFPQLEFFEFVVGHLGVVLRPCTSWSASGSGRGPAR